MESNLFIIKRKQTPSAEIEKNDKNLVNNLEEAIQSLLHRNKLAKALQCMSQVLKLKIKYSGEESQEVTSYLSFILTTISAACLKFLDMGKVQSTIEILRSLLMLANSHMSKSITKEICQVLHTFSCALRKSGNLPLAEKYALKSLSFAKQKISEKLLPSIYLNLCNISSLQSDHKKAAKYCALAVQLGEADYTNTRNRNPDEYLFQEISVLAVSYYNLAVEEEHLKHYDVSLNWYNKALQFLEKDGNDQHRSLLEEIKKNYESAQKGLQKKDKRYSLSIGIEGFKNEVNMVKTSGKSRSHHRINIMKKNDILNKSRSSASSKNLKVSASSLSLNDESKVYSRSSASVKNMLKAVKNRDFSEFSEHSRTVSSIGSKKKYIREYSRISEFMIEAVVKVQSFFKMLKVKTWYKELKNGGFRDRFLKCEKIENKEKTEIAIEIKKKLVSIKAKTQKKEWEETFSLFEICSIISSWKAKDFEVNFFRLFVYIYAEKGIVFRIINSSKIKLSQTFLKESDFGSFNILVYFIYHKQQSVFFYGFPLESEKNIENFLMLDFREIADRVQIDFTAGFDGLEGIKESVFIIEKEGEIGIVFGDKDKDKGKMPNEVDRAFGTEGEAKTKENVKNEYISIDDRAKETDYFELQVDSKIENKENERSEDLIVEFGEEKSENLENICEKPESSVNEEIENFNLPEEKTENQTESQNLNEEIESQSEKIQNINEEIDCQSEETQKINEETENDKKINEEIESQSEKLKKINEEIDCQSENSKISNVEIENKLEMKTRDLEIPKNLSPLKEREDLDLVNKIKEKLNIKYDIVSFRKAITTISRLIRNWKVHKSKYKKKLLAYKFQKTLLFHLKKSLISRITAVQFLTQTPAIEQKDPLETSEKTKSRHEISAKRDSPDLKFSPAEKLKNQILENAENLNEKTVIIQKWLKGYFIRKIIRLYQDIRKRLNNPHPVIFHLIAKIKKSSLANTSKIMTKIKKTSKPKDVIYESVYYYTKVIHKVFSLQYLNQIFSGYSKKLIEFNKVFQEKLLKATVLIQKHIKGYLCRKHLKYKKLLKKNTNPSSINGALLVQKLFRGWKARKEFLELKEGLLVFERCAVVFENTPYLISISKTSDSFVVKSLNLTTFKQLFHKCSLSLQVSEIMLRLKIEDDNLKVSEDQMNHPFKYLLHQERRVIDWEHFMISVFVEPSYYSISATGSMKPMILHVNYSELVERYSEYIDINEIMNDLIIEVNNARIILASKVILLKKSRYFQDKLYTINMYEKMNLLIFEIMFDSTYKKRITLDYDFTVKETGIHSGKLVLGSFIIDNCITINGRRINILLRHKKIMNEHEAIVKIQARIRSFLTKKKLGVKNLVLVCEHEINSRLYYLFCQYHGTKYEINAFLNKNKLTLFIDKRLNHEHMLVYLRKTIIPNLQITQNPEKLIFKISIKPEKLVLRKKISSSQAHTPKAIANDQPSLNPLNIANRSSTIPTKKSPKLTRKIQNYLDHIPPSPGMLTPPMTPLVKPQAEPQKEQEIIRNHELDQVIFKSSLSLSGIFLIVTMQLQRKGVFVQATNESGTIELELFVKSKKTQNLSRSESEQLCSAILSKLKIVTTVDGKLRLTIIDELNDQRDLVIYKRRHIVSNRYLTITIFENARGVFLVASEDEDKSFHIPLGKIRVGNTKKVQEELSSLVKRLKIQTIFGQEMLIVSS